jgi:ABC-type polysaccharide/polyol phosphate export permease
MRINPLTYGTEVLRALLFPGTTTDFSIGMSLAILAAFTTVMFALAFFMANRRTTKLAA